MTLSFSTKFKNGTQNFFIEKIWEGLFRNDIADAENTFPVYTQKYMKKFGKDWDELPSNTRLKHPKIHTMREDKGDRWDKGNDIHFVINNRTKDRFQFAPVVKCVSTQDVFITYLRGRMEITVDEKYLYCNDIEKLIKNDGFDSRNQFIDWFFPKSKTAWNGKIIHWTDFKY
ncbi:hypothetical protein [Arachidicoccus soli]|uniref:Uncharacterized protein n=1 Tax=Arachidicoccus soli TaxID=2341117 RepID=A0A386HQV3_9BACT|nr:hypothetical protein [Arachidicoccus soli]AYD48225.1 hypothetical protein D6B99_11815 [Arachidicoccus soli]